MIKRDTRPMHSVACDCLAALDPDVGDWHHVSEHDHDCGGWTWDPPCGGCYQCIAMQIAYYNQKDT